MECHPCNKSSSSKGAKHCVTWKLPSAKPTGSSSHLEATAGNLHVCIDQAAGAAPTVHLLHQHLSSLPGRKHCAEHCQGPEKSETHSLPPRS